MYSAPLVTNTVFPSVTTASVISYPTTLSVNTLAPSIVYQRQIGAPVFPNFVPLVGIEIEKPSRNEEYFDEKKIDDYIKRRVKEQITEYQNKKDSENSEKYLFITKNNCNCDQFTEIKELTLDEKIERIREELNLTGEKDIPKIIPKFSSYQTNYYENINSANNFSKIDTQNFNCSKNHDIIKFDKKTEPKVIQMKDSLKKILETEKLKYKQNDKDKKELNSKIINFETSLDEKLRILREEKTGQNFKEEFDKKILEYQQKNYCEHSNNLKTHYRIASKVISPSNKIKNEKKKENEQENNQYRIDCLNKSKVDTPFERKMKSPLRSKSHWIPTGVNYYSNTNSKIQELNKKQENISSLNSDLSFSYGFLNHPEPKMNKSFIIRTYKPAQTIYETTIDSQTKIKKPFISKKNNFVSFRTDFSINSNSNSISNLVLNVRNKPLKNVSHSVDKICLPIKRNNTFYI